jgi:hypothetical protein
LCLVGSGSAVELRPHHAQGWHLPLEACLRHGCAQTEMADGAGIEPARPKRSRRISIALPYRSANHPMGSRQSVTNSDCLLPTAYCLNLVSVGGFEPPISCFQGRQGRPGSPTRWSSRSLRQERSRVYLPTSRSVNPARTSGAHGRTRTCTSLVRNQALCPFELRVRCWCRDGERSSGLTVESRRILSTRRSRPIGSPTRIRTWIDRLTAGRPAVGRSGNGGAPRTRNPRSISLQGRSADPARAPVFCFAQGARPSCSACSERWREGSDPREWGGAWGRFRAHLSAASTRRFHQISFPGGLDGAADGNRTRVGAWATRGSAIELRTLCLSGAQSRTRTCGALGHLIYSQASLPLEYLCEFGCGGRTCTCGLRVMSPASCCCSTPRREARATARSPAPGFGGRLTVRTPHPLGCPPVFKTGCRPLQRNLPISWSSRRDLNARPPPSDGGALIH